jgi:PKD repeat protein
MFMKYFLLWIFLGSSVLSSGQSGQFCGTDEMHHQLFEQRPDLNPGILRAYNRLEVFTKDYVKSGHEKGGGPYIIPVVFHIVHNGGPENINDSQIYDAVKQVNLQLRRLNADTTDIVDQFKVLAADCNIEIRLAQLDPDGNCTSGITRTVSPLTAIGDHQVKSLIQWPPDKYLNVYVCAQAAGLAGHALLPSAADTIPEWDGIVMQHSYVGTIGTSDFFRRTVLTHEIGHYLNLQHIWGGNNVPGYYYLPVADAGNCAFDDEVSDTPLTIGWQSCNLGGQSCGSLDNVQNYMDYAYCARMFTYGQRDRMHACLNSPVAGRNNLWTLTNLQATGTDGSLNLCAAKFEADKRIVCVGQTINLTDVSYHGIESRSWQIPGGTLSSTSDSAISVTFDTPGEYTVTLTVFAGSGSVSHSEEAYIVVLPEPGNVPGLYESFESQVSFDTRWEVIPNDLGTNWEIYTGSGYQSPQSFSVQNFEASYTGVFEFVSHPLDVSSLDALLLTFDYAYARKENGPSEVLQVAVSTDCGETWNVRRSFSGNSVLNTMGDTIPYSFVPEDISHWNSESVTNITSQYLTDHLMIKFRFETRSGNNLYIDNIRIGHPNSLEVNDLGENNFSVIPNPVIDELYLEAEQASSIEKLEIWDLSGRLIQAEVPKLLNDQQKVAIDVKEMSSGTYLLKVYCYGKCSVIKFLK